MGFGILTAWPYWSEPTHLTPSPIALAAKLSLTAEKYSTSSKKSWLMRKSVVYILKTSEEHVQRTKVDGRNGDDVFGVGIIPNEPMLASVDIMIYLVIFPTR